MKNILKPLTKKVLILLGITAAASSIDGVIYKKMFGSVSPSDLASEIAVSKISNVEINDMMEIIKSLEESGLLIKDVRETVKDETKE